MTNTLSPHRYTLGSLLTALLLLLTMAVLNWLVNPYLLFNPPRIAGINEAATENFFKQLLIKPHKLRRVAPRSVIVGTSHAGIAFNPDRLPQPAFNLAVGGATSYINYRFIQEAFVANPALEHVILEVPLFAFNAFDDNNQPGQNPDFENRLSVTVDGKPNPSRLLHTLRDYLSALLSWESARSSFRMLQKQEKVKEGKRSSFIQYHNGQWLQLQGRNMSTRRYFENSWKKFLHDEWAPAPHHTFALHRDGQSPGLDYYRQSLKQLYQHNTHTVIVIAPLHASLLLALQESGLWATYAEWKEQIVQINHAEALAHGHAPFEILDYTGLNEQTQEELPTDATSTERLRWFFDSAHASPEFGDAILAEIQASERHLGISLTLNNLSSHLDEQLKASTRYGVQHPDELAVIRQLIETSPAKRTVSSRESNTP